MNGFDIVTFVLIGLAARRGFKNGLASEFYRLLRVLIALFAGTSLYRIFSDSVSGLLNINSGYSDPILFVVAMVITWKLLRRIRRWIESVVLAITPQKVQAIGGALAAGCKTCMLIFALVATVSLSTWLPGRAWIAEDSFTGKIVQSFLPET